MSVSDPIELLFWALMRRFEVLALECYRTHVPALGTPEKANFVADVVAQGEHDGLLAQYELEEPIEGLLSTARSTDAGSTLIVQGLVLEQLGQAIYGIVATTERDLSAPSRTLAERGLAASRSVTAQIPAHLERHVGVADELWTRFADASHDVLGALDQIADPVDRVFGGRFGLHFADVMGEFTADLIVACTALDLPRRKVVAHLAGAAMGF